MGNVHILEVELSTLVNLPQRCFIVACSPANVLNLIWCGTANELHQSMCIL